MKHSAWLVASVALLSLLLGACSPAITQAQSTGGKAWVSQGGDMYHCVAKDGRAVCTKVKD